MSDLFTLHYGVECDGNNNYIIYLSETTVAKADKISAEIYDEISSTAVSIAPNLISSSNGRTVAEVICEKIKQLLDTAWDLESLGVPVVNFNFINCKKIGNNFRHHPVLIFTTGVTDKVKAVAIWQAAIKMLPKFTFLGSYPGKPFDLITQDSDFIYPWLQRYTTDTVLNGSLKYNCTHLLKSWYHDELLETLQQDSFREICTYVIRANINRYIPEYLIVPMYHVKRYRKAMDILATKYAQALIMTIPLPGTEYLILFPIPE